MGVAMYNGRCLMADGRFFLLFVFLCFCAPVFSQGGDGKSKKIETIDGKKYYIHTVEKGQTLYAISKIYGLEVNDIVIENPEAMDGIKPGQVIKVPTAKPKIKEVAVKADSGKYSYHKVEQGQTLYAIAKMYNMKEEAVMALNPTVKDGIKAGQMLKLPPDKKGNAQFNNRSGALVVPDTAKVKEFSTVKKDLYNIGLFLPFQSDGIDLVDADKVAKGLEDLPAKMDVAIQFYKGAMMALDSLKKRSVAVKLFVYDVDDKDSLKVAQMLKKPELTSLDLIIGPLYTSSFVPVMKFAADHRIPAVSPLSQQNKILFNNVYISKATPSVTTQLEQCAKFIADSFPTANILLLNNSNPKDAAYVSTYRKNLQADLPKKNPGDTLKEIKSLGGLVPFLSPTKTNVVIVPSVNQSYVTDILRRLNELAEKNKFVVFGMSNWNSFENLDIEYLNTLEFHYPHYFYVNYSDPSTKNFIRQYREANKTEPGSYVYHGFDVMFYYANALHTYGTGFAQKMPENPWSGVQTGFNYYQPSSGSGLENRYVYILRYRDYKVNKAN